VLNRLCFQIKCARIRCLIRCVDCLSFKNRSLFEIGLICHNAKSVFLIKTCSTFFPLPLYSTVYPFILAYISHIPVISWNKIVLVVIVENLHLFHKEQRCASDPQWSILYHIQHVFLVGWLVALFEEKTL